MKNKRGGVDWLRLLGENGWQWNSEKSCQEEYSFYEARIFGCQYYVACWARVSDRDDGYNASGDWGVAWIECDVSEYTSKDFLCMYDVQEIISAIDHAETNLLRCGVPFVSDYGFNGKNASNKARRNAAIRKKLGLKTKEETLHDQRMEGGQT